MGDGARVQVPERAGRDGDQPLPTEGVGDVIAELVLRVGEQLQARRELGIRRYGRALQLFNGRDPFQDHVEELLDQHVYAEQIRLEYRALEEAVCVLGRRVRGEDVPDFVLASVLELVGKLEERRAKEAGRAG